MSVAQGILLSFVIFLVILCWHEFVVLSCILVFVVLMVNGHQYYAITFALLCVLGKILQGQTIVVTLAMLSLLVFYLVDNQFRLPF